MRYHHHTSRESRRAKYRNRSGNAVLDMALVMPVLIYLTFGACEYGYALFVKHSLQAAAREGARAAIVSGAVAADVQTAVDSSMLASGFAQATYTRPPTVTPSTWASSAAGTTVQVTVNTTWGSIGVHLLPSGMGGISSSKAMSGSTTMRKEG